MALSSNNRMELTGVGVLGSFITAFAYQVDDRDCDEREDWPRLSCVLHYCFPVFFHFFLSVLSVCFIGEHDGHGMVIALPHGVTPPESTPPVPPHSWHTASGEPGR